jgi:hypothetical protein
VAIERTTFFDMVRDDPFPGSLTQGQVNGMNRLLDVLERDWSDWRNEKRFPAYCFATCMWETGSKMEPVEEYQGAHQPYGQPDPETKQCYYGRGDVQLTHRENYARADRELGLEGALSCEWHAENALNPEISAAVLFRGLEAGWFRSPNNLSRYFNASRDDAYNCRECVNGDKAAQPSWAAGAKIGDLIAAYHGAFLRAFEASWHEEVRPQPGVVEVLIIAPSDVKVLVKLMQEDLDAFERDDDAKQV